MIMWHVPMVTHPSIIVTLRSLILEFLGDPYQALRFKPPSSKHSYFLTSCTLSIGLD